MARSAPRKTIRPSESVADEATPGLPAMDVEPDSAGHKRGGGSDSETTGLGNNAGCRYVMGDGDGCHFIVNVNVQYFGHDRQALPGGRSQPLVEVHVHVHQHGSGPVVPLVAGADAPTDDAAG